MPQAPSYMSPGSEFDLANQQANRQRQLAQMLREQSAQPLQGQMAGQIYVPPSWTQGLAKLLQGYTARKTDEAADTKLQDARTAYNTRNSASTQALVDALSGTPAQKAPEGSAQFGDIMETPDTPAQPPDINKALGVALGNQDNPLLAGFAGKVLDSKLSGLLPKTPKWEKYEKPDGRGGMVSGFVDINSQNPLGTFQQGGAQPAKREFVNGQGVNPYTGDAQGPAIPKQADAANPRTELLVDDGTGKLVPNKPLIDARGQIAERGAPKIGIDARNYSTQESEQSKAYGKTLGDIRSDITRAGYEAHGKLAQLDRMEQLLSGVGGGKGAPLLADMASFAQSIGIKLDPKLGEKDAAEALALNMASSLRKPGTGPMTDKDFDNFMKQVPSLSKTPEGRKQIMTTLRAAIERDKMADEFARNYAKQNGGVIDDNFFGAMAGFYSQNKLPQPKMPETGSSGRIFQDADAILNRGKK